jgi:hypothetical protein
MEEPKPKSEKNEIIEEVIGFRVKKFVYTFKQLLLRPGESVASFCDGNRNDFVKPITYFIFCWGISYVIATASAGFELGFNLGHKMAGGETDVNLANPSEDLLTAFHKANPEIPKEEFVEVTNALGKGVQFITSQQGLLLSFFPVMVLFQWLFFKRFRKPFHEHLYFFLYCTAQINILSIPFIVITVLFPSTYFLIVSMISIASIIYLLRAEYEFYQPITYGQVLSINSWASLAAIIPLIIWFLMVWVIAAFIYWALS